MTLKELAEKHGSDKAKHGYCEVYEAYWGEMADQSIDLLEIGVKDGASHRMWLDFFPQGRISGMENAQYGNPADRPEDARFKVMGGDQGKLSALWEVAQALGPFDIIIDDGGHTMWQQQLSFAALAPWVKPGGYYVIEDLHTSLMDKFYINAPGMPPETVYTGAKNAPETTLEMLERLIGLGLDACIHRLDNGKSITAVIRMGKEAK